LFLFVAVVAVACAALARPSQLWLAVVSASSLASLFYALLATAYGRNARRAFWVGFAKGLGRSSALSSVLGKKSFNLGVGHGLSQMIVDADPF
jgi:hypothetical protein